MVHILKQFRNIYKYNSHFHLCPHLSNSLPHYPLKQVTMYVNFLSIYPVSLHTQNIYFCCCFLNKRQSTTGLALHLAY